MSLSDPLVNFMKTGKKTFQSLKIGSFFYFSNIVKLCLINMLKDTFLIA